MIFFLGGGGAGTGEVLIIKKRGDLRNVEASQSVLPRPCAVREERGRTIPTVRCLEDRHGDTVFRGLEWTGLIKRGLGQDGLVKTRTTKLRTCKTQTYQTRTF